jgi:hypothetical protein
MTDTQRIILVGLAAALIGFAFGAFWQHTSVRAHARELEATRYDLTFQRLEATLGAATIEAQRGSYEIGRQLASQFFSGLQNELAAAGPERRQAFEQILEQRDAMITALSRGDPQSGSMLAQLFVRYRIEMGEPVGPNAGAASPSAMPQDSPAGQP